MIEINLILVFMILCAMIAVGVKDLLSSVVAVGAVGVGLSLAFLTLKAPDLAMLQLVVEILSLIILIRATIRKDLPFSTSGRWYFNTTSTLIFLVIFIVAAYFSIKNLAPFADPAMRVSRIYLEEAAGARGAHNIVGGITLGFRVLDTLAEAAIIFAAVIGVLAVARKISHKEGARR